MGKKYNSFKVARKTARKIGKEGFTGKGGIKEAKRRKKVAKKVVRKAKQYKRGLKKRVRQNNKSIKRTNRRRK